MPLTIRFMHRQDISQVTEIDHDAFPTEWPPTNFQRELENKLAYYIVAYETQNINPQSNAKPYDREIQPGFFDRVRRIFSRNQISKDEPSEEVPFLAMPACGLWLTKPMLPASPHIKDHRHQGIGEALLICLIELAIAKHIRIVTLEARVSNQVAQNLYYKFGFDKLGVRKAYYLDNKEDAVIMSTEYIGSPSFKEKFTQVKQAYYQKLGAFTNELSVS